MSAPKRTKRRGETPGQERHSGRTAKAFLTLSLLRAHFYTGVFHTSYVRSARQTDINSEVVSVLPSLCSEQGAAPLALLCSYPADAPHLLCPLRVQNDFANHSVPTRLKIITQRVLPHTATKGFARSYRINLRLLPELAFSSEHDGLGGDADARSRRG